MGLAINFRPTFYCFIGDENIYPNFEKGVKEVTYYIVLLSIDSLSWDVIGGFFFHLII